MTTPKTTKTAKKLRFSRTFNVRLSHQMDDAVRKEAVATDQKPTELIRQAIRHHLKRLNP